MVSDVNAITNSITFTNGKELIAGDVFGDVGDDILRRIQIREAIKAHFDKEKALFSHGVKVLSLFFIDEVIKYRDYSRGDEKGDYARIFEEEYSAYLNEMGLIEDTPYNRYLKGISTNKTHSGYFSIDKKSKKLIDPAVKGGEADDVDAYDLILKDKERLLSFDEPVRFIFSHSALREGWDNPNVFVICALKHSDNTISRRQEVGRGLRLSVNQDGDRMDDPSTVHQTNVLTVVASEGYDFVTTLEAVDRNSTKCLDAIEQMSFMYQNEDMVRQMMDYLARHRKPMLAWGTPTHKYFVETYLERLALIEKLEAVLRHIRKSVMSEQWGDAIIELFSQAGQIQGGKHYQTNEKEIYEERETPEAQTYSRQWDQFMTQNYDRKSSSTQ